MRKLFAFLVFISGLVTCNMPAARAEQTIYGKIDFEDFSVLASHWLQSKCGACGGADLTGDGAVDVHDLQKLVAHWLEPPPFVNITSPPNGATVDTSSVTVSGTVDQRCDVIVNGVEATIDGNTFTAKNVSLCTGENTIKATAFGFASYSSSHAINVTTTGSCLLITKVSSDVYKYDPTNIVAGSHITLIVAVNKNGIPALNEPVAFAVVQGSGSLSPPIVSTDPNGKAISVLTTDVNAAVTNIVEVFDQNFPSKKIVFHIDTKARPPANLVKLTDESIHPAPGATIDLIVRLEDSNNNIVSDEEIAYQIISGIGTISANDVNTNEFGLSRTQLTTPASPNTSCVVQAQSTSNPILAVTFNITTSPAPLVGPNDVIDRVLTNDSLILDVMADINVTSDTPWMPAYSVLKIWIKGNKQKVQEIFPKPGVHIRPVIDANTVMEKEIVSYDSATDVYVLRLRRSGQTETHPYVVHHIDYGKGVILKTEYHILKDDIESVSVIKYSDFVQTNGAWGYRKQVDEFYQDSNQLLYTTTHIYSNIQINTGIPDSVFE